MSKICKYKPLIILGGGGHASVLVDILLQQGRVILAIVCPDSVSSRCVFNGLSHFKNDADVLQFDTSDVLLVNGIGALPERTIRGDIFRHFKELGYQFETIVSQHAVVSPHANLASGVQVLHNAVVQPGSSIGENTIINTGTIVEHDCQVGSNNHIAPRATLCGQVSTCKNVYIGAGATIIQNIHIGHDSLVGAGATITYDLDCEHIAYGGRPAVRKRVGL